MKNPFNFDVHSPRRFGFQTIMGIMKKKIMTLLTASVSVTMWGQQALFDVNNLTSPEINNDRSVTFRMFAPAATTVEVEGDFGEKGTMKKSDDGVWTYTTAPLEPEMYSYRFKVDGIDVLDPSMESMFSTPQTFIVVAT